MLDTILLYFLLLITNTERLPDIPKADFWTVQTQYWTDYLKSCYFPVCHLRIDIIGPLRAENGSILEDKLDVPEWVLEQLNKGYDLNRLEPDNLIWIPAVHWKTHKRCIDPIRYKSSHH